MWVHNGANNEDPKWWQMTSSGSDHETWLGCRITSKQSFLVKVVFFGRISPTLVAARVSSDARLQKHSSLLCTLQYRRPEEQLCGLNHQSTDGDESTHSAAPRKTQQPRGAVYHSPDFPSTYQKLGELSLYPQTKADLWNLLGFYFANQILWERRTWSCNPEFVQLKQSWFLNFLPSFLLFSQREAPGDKLTDNE